MGTHCISNPHQDRQPSHLDNREEGKRNVSMVTDNLIDGKTYMVINTRNKEGKQGLHVPDIAVRKTSAVTTAADLRNPVNIAIFRLALLECAFGALNSCRIWRPEYNIAEYTVNAAPRCAVNLY